MPEVDLASAVRFGFSEFEKARARKEKRALGVAAGREAQAERDLKLKIARIAAGARGRGRAGISAKERRIESLRKQVESIRGRRKPTPREKRELPVLLRELDELQGILVPPEEEAGPTLASRAAAGAAAGLGRVPGLVGEAAGGFGRRLAERVAGAFRGAPETALAEPGETTESALRRAFEETGDIEAAKARVRKLRGRIR